jgi:CheY-like chemotaxis protein
MRSRRRVLSPMRSTSCNRERFDLILLDMVMPGMGTPCSGRQGLDLLKRVRDLGVNAAGPHDERRLREPEGGRRADRGGIRYLHKPFDLRDWTVSSPAPSRPRPVASPAHGRRSPANPSAARRNWPRWSSTRYSMTDPSLEQRLRNRQPESLRSLDDQFGLHRLLTAVPGLSPLRSRPA